VSSKPTHLMKLEIHNEGGADYKEIHSFDEEITDEGTIESEAK